MLGGGRGVGGVGGKPIFGDYPSLLGLVLKGFVGVVGNVDILFQALLPLRGFWPIGGEGAPHEAGVLPAPALLLQAVLLPPLGLDYLVLHDLHCQLIEPILPTELDCDLIGVVIVPTSDIAYLMASSSFLPSDSSISR